MDRSCSLQIGGVHFLVDQEDYQVLRSFHWRKIGTRSTNGIKWRAFRRVRSGIGKRLTILMHRQIMNAHSGVEVDHINGDPTDNRKSNLRLCTHSENGRNMVKRANTKGVPTSSKYKGV